MMRSISFAALVVALSGCMASRVSVRIDHPEDTEVTIAEGVDTPAMRARTPFRRTFEATGPKLSLGYPLVMRISPAMAARYGRKSETLVFGRLNVGEPTSFSRGQQLRLHLEDASLGSLLKGEVSEVNCFVEDPSTPGADRLAQLTLSLAEL